MSAEPDSIAANEIAFTLDVLASLRDLAKRLDDWTLYSRCVAAVEALSEAQRLLQDSAEHVRVSERFATRAEHLRHDGADLVRYYRTTYPILMICKACGQPVRVCGHRSEAACRAAQAAGEEQ